MKNKWFDGSLVQGAYQYRLCLNEKDFHAELKRLKVPVHDWPPFLNSQRANATCHYLENNNNQLAIVCMDYAHAKKRHKVEVYGLLVHEAVHIWQECMDSIGEKEPSSEFEAYSIQRIAQDLIYSYMEQTK